MKWINPFHIKTDCILSIKKGSFCSHLVETVRVLMVVTLENLSITSASTNTRHLKKITSDDTKMLESGIFDRTFSGSYDSFVIFHDCSSPCNCSYTVWISLTVFWNFYVLMMTFYALNWSVKKIFHWEIWTQTPEPHKEMRTTTGK